MNSLLPYETFEQDDLINAANGILGISNPLKLAYKSRQLENLLHFKYTNLSYEVFRGLVLHYAECIKKMCENDDLWEVAKSVVVSLSNILMHFHEYKMGAFMSLVDFEPILRRMMKQNTSLLQALIKLMLYLKPFARDKMDLDVQPIQLRDLIESHSISCLLQSTFVDGDDHMAQLKNFAQKLNLAQSLVQLKCLDANYVDFYSRIIQDANYELDMPSQRIILDIAMRWFELPIGSGLSNSWSVGSKNILSNAHYNNQSIQQFEHVNQSFMKVRRDKFKSVAIIVLYGVHDLSMIEQWMNAIETFLHPQNQGRWTGPIVKFIRYLAQELHHRLLMEQCQQVSYGKERYLSSEKRDRIVMIFVPLLEMTCYGKDAMSARESYSALKHLAWVQPDIIPGVVQRVSATFVGLDLSHRMTSSLKILSTMSMPMVHRLHSPASVAMFGGILQASLPGIDMNDTSKCFSSLLLVSKYFAILPLHEIKLGFDKKLVPQLVHYYHGPFLADFQLSDVLEQESSFEHCRLLQHMLPDFLYQMLAKIESLFENLPHGSENAVEGSLMQLVVFLMDVTVRQCSASNLQIIESWLMKVIDLKYYTSSKSFAHVLTVFLASKPQSINLLLQHLMLKVEQELSYGSGSGLSLQKLSFECDDAAHGRHKDSALWHYLVLLRGCASCVGYVPPHDQSVMVSNLCKHVQKIWPLIGSRTCYSVLSRIIRTIVMNLGGVYLIESGTLTANSSDEEVASESFLWGVSPYERTCHALNVPIGFGVRGFRESSSSQVLVKYTEDQRRSFWESLRSRLSLQWHLPNINERKHILTLLEVIVEPELSLLESLVLQPVAGDNRTTAVAKLCKSMTMLYHVSQSIAGILDSDPKSLKSTQQNLRQRYSSSSSYYSEYDATELESMDALDDDDVDIAEGLLDIDGDDQGDEEEGPDSVGSKKPLPAGYAFNDVKSQDYQYVLSIRLRIGQILLSLGNFIQQYYLDDIELSHILIKIVCSHLTDRGIEKHKYEDLKRSYHFTKSIIRVGANREVKMYPKYLFLKRIALLHVQRLKHNGVAEFGNLVDDEVCQRLLLDQLLNLACCQYEQLRNQAIEVINGTLRAFPAHKSQLLDRLFVRVQTAVESVQQDLNKTKWHQVIIGGLSLVYSKQLFNMCKRQWKFVAGFMNVLAAALHVDDPIVQKIAAGLMAEYSNKFMNQPIHVESLLPTENTSTKFVNMMLKKRDENMAIINTSIQQLIRLQGKSKHWKITSVVLNYMVLYVRCDVSAREDVTKFAVKSLTDESLPVRMIAQLLTKDILKSIKSMSVAQLKRQGQLNYKNVLQEDQWELRWQTCDVKSYGWVVFPKTFVSYSLDGVFSGSLACDKGSQDAVAVLKQAFGSVTFWQQYFQYITQESAQNSQSRRNGQSVAEEVFSTQNVEFYKRVFQLFQDSFLYDVVVPIVQPWFTKYDDKPLQRASAEFLAGLIRGTKLWNPQQLAKFWVWALPQLKLILLGSTPQSLQNWHNFLNQAFHKRSAVRMRPMIDLILKDNNFQQNPDTDAAFVEYKKLTYIRFVISNYYWNLQSEVVTLLPKFASNLDHQYKNVRDMSAAILNECSLALFKPVALSSSQYAYVDVVELVDKLLRPQNIVQECFRGAANQIRIQKQKIGSDLVYGSSYSNVAKCVMQWLAEAFSAGRPHLLMPLLLSDDSSLLKDIFEMQTSDDVDLCSLAVGILNFFPDVALSSFDTKAQIVRFVNFIKFEVATTFVDSKVEEEASRRIKLRSLAMLQVFFFRHLFYILESEGNIASEMVDVVLKLSVDSHVEVRVLSSITMSGIVRCFSQSDGAMLTHKLLRTYSSMLQSDNLATKHAGVLGASALVLSFPYEIPVWLPDLLVTLSCHVKDPSPVGQTVKQIFADFRRSHQDTWQEDVLNGAQDDYLELYGYGSPTTARNVSNGTSLFDAKQKGVFTTKHLEALEGLLVTSASYYA